MRGTKDMDYVWCPLREEGLFNFTDDQLMAVGHLQKLLEDLFENSFLSLVCDVFFWPLFLNMSRPQAEKAGAATTFCIDGREAADKNPTRYINAARTQEQPIWHYMPSMAVYFAWLYEVGSIDGP